MWLRPAVAAAAQALLGVWPSDSDVGFFFSPRSSLDSELTSLCQSVLEDFNLCLFYLPSPPNLSSVSEDEEEYESGYSFLPDLLIFRMVIICFMSVHSLRRAGELCWDAQNLSAGSHQLVFSWRSVLGGRSPRPHRAVLAGSKQYSAAIAFTLALFSHLINHVNIRLQAELEEGENPVPAFRSDGTGRCALLPTGGAFTFWHGSSGTERNCRTFPPPKSRFVTPHRMRGWASPGQRHQ